MKFVCDTMLGKLAKYLRTFGLDTEYIKNMKEREIFAHPDESFYLLTRRTDIKDRDRVIFIRSDKPSSQLKEIRHIVGPYLDPGKAMTRCIICNMPLIHILRADVEQYVPEFVFHRYKTFVKCPQCGKIYWEGSHTVRMSQFMEEVFGEHPVE